MDDDLLDNADLNYFYYHGMTGQQLWEDTKAACCGSKDANGDNCNFVQKAK